MITLNLTRETRNEALLKEIRERYTYASDKWRESRDERRKDMRYISGDPWDETDRKARADAGRPCINHDELNQYVNQAINNLRQNKRGIKASPAGNGADDKTADFRGNHIRTIEYKSHAQTAYIAAFESSLQGGYGFFRISRKYEKGSFNQEICIKPIENPDSVLYDPDCKEPDWSDPQYVFVLDPMPKEDFKRKYPKAQTRDFSTEDMRIASDWIHDKHVLVAEYWRVEIEEESLYLLPSGEIATELPDGVEPLQERTEQVRRIVQYHTNGVEILDRIPQPDDYIPVIMMTGRKIWVDEGAGPKWKLISMVRLARGPQMSLAYLNSQQMEEAGLTPKTPYVGYKGQFESDAEVWETITKIPHAYVQADPVVDGATGQVLPLPRREPFTPNFQQYEVAKESARRAIQAAMGISPLPTSAQRQNEKSGIALERIQQQQAIGTFHFVDNYDRAVEFGGRILDAWIPITYDTPREMSLSKNDDSREQVTINQPFQDPKTGEDRMLDVNQGDHDITISTGPSDASQREAASEFLDTLIGSLGKLPIAPPQSAKLLSLAIRMKQLGPIGDQMADIISPEEDGGQQLPPEVQQGIQQLQQKMQALNAYAQQVEKEKEELRKKLDAKVIENEGRLEIERLKIDADLAKAEIMTKAQNVSERMAFIEDVVKQLQEHGQQANMLDAQHQHDAQMAAQDHQAQAQQQQQEQAAAAQQQQPEQVQQ